MLLARSDWTAESKGEGQAHFLQSPTRARQDDASPEPNSPDAPLLGGQGGHFPLFGDFSQEADIRKSGGFRHRFIRPPDAIAVDTRHRDKGLGRLLEACQGSGE